MANHKESHIDDEIFRVREFIQELDNVRERYFKELLQKVADSDEYKPLAEDLQWGEDDLFDYIFDHDEETDKLTFSEYLEQQLGPFPMIDEETHDENDIANTLQIFDDRARWVHRVWSYERLNSVDEEIKGQTYMPSVDEYNNER